MRRHLAMWLLLIVAPIGTLHADEPVDLIVVSHIRAEGFDNSQVMEHVSYMTDVAGPRLTGSPGLARAMQWCRDAMSGWGMVNAHLEAWGDFGRGWGLEGFSIEMTEPYFMPIIAYPKAWTPSTEGTIEGAPVLLDAETDEDFEKFKGKLKGAIVLVMDPREAEQHFEPDATRFTAEQLAELTEIRRQGEVDPERRRRTEQFRAARAVRTKRAKFAREEGAAVVLEPSRGEHGTLFVTSG